MSFPTPISYAPPPVFPLSVLGFRFLPLRSMVGLCYFSYTVIDPDVISVFCKWKSIFSGTLVEDAFFSPVDVVGIFVTFKRLKLSMLMFNNSVLFCLSGLHICFLWWFHFSLLLLWLCTVSWGHKWSSSFCSRLFGLWLREHLLWLFMNFWYCSLLWRMRCGLVGRI